MVEPPLPVGAGLGVPDEPVGVVLELGGTVELPDTVLVSSPGSSEYVLVVAALVLEAALTLALELDPELPTGRTTPPWILPVEEEEEVPAAADL